MSSARPGPGAVRTAKDVPELAPYIRDSTSVLERARASGGRIFIEGTQGTGLSILHGSFPHVTSRDTTVSTLLAEVGVPPQLLRRVIVAFRTYPIRVGGESGPMGREITWDMVARRSGLPADILKGTERGSVSGNPRRVAEFSWSQLRHSARINGATDLALTFADYIDARNRGARRFNQLTDETVEMIYEMESVAAAPVSLVSATFDGLCSLIRTTGLKFSLSLSHRHFQASTPRSPRLQHCLKPVLAWCYTSTAVALPGTCRETVSAHR